MYATPRVAVDLAKPDCATTLLTRAQKPCDRDGTIRLLHVLRGAVTDKLRASSLAGLPALSGKTDPRRLPVLREGAVARQFCAMAEADKADLVLLDSRLPGMPDLCCDTTTTKLTRHSTISVLVARTPNPERILQHV